MRNQKGKLITVFVPGNHGAGGTTIASGIGISLQYFLNKKVLIVNKSGFWSYMERFVENESGLKFKYSIDDLKVFNSSIKKDYIKNFATRINDDLYIIAGSSYSKEIDAQDVEFEDKFIEESLDAFDFVVIDAPTGVRDENIRYLKSSDLVLAVMTPNDIMLDDIYNKPAKASEKEFIKASNSISVFNFMSDGPEYDKELNRLNKKYKLNSSYGVIFDSSVRAACCVDKKFYTYLRNELDKINHVFPQQMKELTAMVCNRMDVDLPFEAPVKKNLLKTFLNRF